LKKEVEKKETRERDAIVEWLEMPYDTSRRDRREMKNRKGRKLLGTKVWFKIKKKH